MHNHHQHTTAVALLAPPLPSAPRSDLHAAAFRDLESAICECAMMANIAVQLASTAQALPPEALFAVTHTSEMMDALKARYFAHRASLICGGVR